MRCLRGRGTTLRLSAGGRFAFLMEGMIKMKKILGYALIGMVCFAIASARGVWNTKSFNTGGAVDSSSLSFPGDSTTTAPDGRIKTSDGSRLIDDVSATRDLMATFIIGASTETDVGFGLDDTAFLSVVTLMEGRPDRTIATANCASIPCTLVVAVDLDTLLWKGLQLVWRTYDSAGGRVQVVGATYPINTYVLKRE